MQICGTHAFDFCLYKLICRALLLTKTKRKSINQWKSFESRTELQKRKMVGRHLLLLAAPFRGCHSRSSVSIWPCPLPPLLLHPAIFMSSFATSINLLCGLPLSLLPGSFIFNILCPIHRLMYSDTYGGNKQNFYFCWMSEHSASIRYRTNQIKLWRQSTLCAKLREGEAYMTECQKLTRGCPGKRSPGKFSV